MRSSFLCRMVCWLVFWAVCGAWGTWTARASSVVPPDDFVPSIRKGTVFYVLSDGRIFVCGGRTGDAKASAYAAVFEPTQECFPGRCAARLLLCEPRAYHSMDPGRGGSCLVSGGRNERGGLSSLVERFEPGSLSIDGLFVMERGRAKHVLIEDDSGHIYVIGGKEEDGPSLDVLRFEPGSAEAGKIGRLPRPLCPARGCLDDGGSILCWTAGDADSLLLVEPAADGVRFRSPSDSLRRWLKETLGSEIRVEAAGNVVVFRPFTSVLSFSPAHGSGKDDGRVWTLDELAPVFKRRLEAASSARQKAALRGMAAAFSFLVRLHSSAALGLEEGERLLRVVSGVEHPAVDVASLRWSICMAMDRWFRGKHGLPMNSVSRLELDVLNQAMSGAYSCASAPGTTDAEAESGASGREATPEQWMAALKRFRREGLIGDEEFSAMLAAPAACLLSSFVRDRGEAGLDRQAAWAALRRLSSLLDGLERKTLSAVSYVFRPALGAMLKGAYAPDLLREVAARKLLPMQVASDVILNPRPFVLGVSISCERYTLEVGDRARVTIEAYSWDGSPLSTPLLELEAAGRGASIVSTSSGAVVEATSPGEPILRVRTPARSFELPFVVLPQGSIPSIELASASSAGGPGPSGEDEASGDEFEYTAEETSGDETEALAEEAGDEVSGYGEESQEEEGWSEEAGYDESYDDSYDESAGDYAEGEEEYSSVDEGEDEVEQDQAWADDGTDDDTADVEDGDTGGVADDDAVDVEDDEQDAEQGDTGGDEDHGSHSAGGGGLQIPPGGLHLPVDMLRGRVLVVLGRIKNVLRSSDASGLSSFMTPEAWEYYGPFLKNNPSFRRSLEETLRRARTVVRPSAEELEPGDTLQVELEVEGRKFPLYFLVDDDGNLKLFAF